MMTTIIRIYYFAICVFNVFLISRSLGRSSNKITHNTISSIIYICEILLASTLSLAFEKFQLPLILMGIFVFNAASFFLTVPLRAKLRKTNSFAMVRETNVNIPGEEADEDKKEASKASIFLSRFWLYREITSHSNVSMVVFFIIVISFIVNGFSGASRLEDGAQLKALALLCGRTENYYVFNEENLYLHDPQNMSNESFSTLFDEDYYKAIADSNKSLVPDNYDGEVSDTMGGVFYGIPSYSALLALVGCIFGYTNMNLLNPMLTFIQIVLLLAIARNFRLDDTKKMYLLLLSLLSPQMLWVNHSTVSAGLQVILILAIVYGLTSPTQSIIRGLILASFATIGLCYVDSIGIFLLPVITFAFIIVAIRLSKSAGAKAGKSNKSSKKQFLIPIYMNMIISIFAIPAILFIYNFCKRYFYLSFASRISFLSASNADFASRNALFAGVILCVVIFVLNLSLLAYPVRRLLSKLMSIRLYSISLAALVVVGFVIVLFRLVSAPIDTDTKPIESIVLSSLYALVLITGIVVLPVAAFQEFRSIFSVSRSLCREILFVMMFGTVITILLFYPQINTIYAGSAILATVVSLIALSFVTNIRQTKTLHYIAIVACLYLLPYTVFTSTFQDNTLLSWNDIEKYIDEVEDADACIMDYNTMGALSIVTDLLTDTDIFYRVDNGISFERIIRESYETIYFLSFDNHDLDSYYDMRMLRSQNTGADTYSSYLSRLDANDQEAEDNNKHSDFNLIELLHLPFYEYNYGLRTLHFYDYDILSRLQTEFERNDYLLYAYNSSNVSGLGNPEDGFAWASSEPVQIEFFAPCINVSNEDNDGSIETGYRMIIDLNMSVNIHPPVFEVHNGYPMTIWINDEEFATIDASNQEMWCDVDSDGEPDAWCFEFDLAEFGDMISLQDYNSITIAAPTWSPSDFGSPDERILSYAFSNVAILSPEAEYSDLIE